CFRKTIRIEDQDVSYCQRKGNLSIVLLLAESQGHIVALEKLTRTRSASEMNCLGVATIDNRESTLLQIEARIAKGREDSEADELLDHFALHQHDNLFRFGKDASYRRGQQAAKRAWEVTLDRRPQEGCRHSFAHHVSDHDVEAASAVLEKIVEVPIN